MRKLFASFLALLLVFSLAACASDGQTSESGGQASENTGKETGDVTMQYMTAEEALAVLNTEGYTFIDLRAAADYEEAHIPGSILISMKDAVDGDTAAGEDAMKTGTAGISDTLILICYSGKSYAQAGTNALSAIGYDMSKVYTLEGGFNNWKEVNPNFVESGSGDSGEAEPAPEDPGVAAVENTKVYVSPEWLKSVIDGGQNESADYVILECAWGEVEFDPSYTKGHIPGALHMNTDYIEEENYWNIRTDEEIEALMANYGITKDTAVICYGDGATNSADDRVAFMALWAGVENVKVLDGGLDAWKDAGYDLESGENTPTVTDAAFGVAIPAHPEYILSDKEVLDKLGNDGNFRLVSIRSWDEFTGVTSGYSYIDRAGEPEGAIWGHDTDDASYNNADGTTVGLDVLEGYLGDAASTSNELSFYCGTGWRASIPFLICYENGVKNVSMYDGGWFVWQMNGEYPVQVGDPASEDCVYTTVAELSTDKAA